MRIVFFTFLIVFGAVSAAESKNVKTDVALEMERADKIESYKAKKDLAWHKTEYNKVLKYLKKTKK
ncbi:Uncharacterised protein [Sebaldella termitidis]|jgi:hypothetical protein|uniref:Uncharacterized protein n=1 Tax=Sebaldella termitidis (strain ATCC 33386 / NCTC 11300) TaxID=526218 RepID=D1AQF3_SEBTE|nr:hypothetical protein [Sebaldella termitidis]ACZ10213.1 hypothetical protein Sterm_3374 [Sebaldella termitidis ATCC 33386]MBP7978842.1 hypothetical protein [Sebaldella sp.]SUI25552.1 Uncharacterised protein [Sebaldella termitidis]